MIDTPIYDETVQALRERSGDRWPAHDVDAAAPELIGVPKSCPIPRGACFGGPWWLCENGKAWTADLEVEGGPVEVRRGAL